MKYLYAPKPPETVLDVDPSIIDNTYLNPEWLAERMLWLEKNFDAGAYRISMKGFHFLNEGDMILFKIKFP